ncbi:hypothetical protein [Actinopolymorpha pittospori]|jgi:hypothetical protein|uniref:Uncharacterized protein n=1 Tax=Actinopolymorpha pittospori TaxID=648752 RepID=A0A927RCV5_9ACTN|nr:hypothetical protein [Actinopolymorpha pittospori]MBE1607470.1 hypothetical protein [Actinopolymorpha pittospori]
MIGTSWKQEREAIERRIAACRAQAGRRAAEAADCFYREGVEAAPAWDATRERWGVRIIEPANDELHMYLWLDNDRWHWVPGCPWSAGAEDYDKVVRFAVAWVTDHKVLLG